MPYTKFNHRLLALTFKFSIPDFLFVLLPVVNNNVVFFPFYYHYDANSVSDSLSVAFPTSLKLGVRSHVHSIYI